MQWQVFNWLFGLVVPPMNAAATAGAAVLSTWVQPLLILGLMAYGAGSLIWSTLSGGQRSMERFLEVLVGGAVAIFITSMAQFGPLVRDFVLVDLMQGFGSALSGIAQGAALNAQVFDQIWLRSFASGLAVLRNAPWSVAGLGLVAIVLLFWGVSAGAVAVAFGVWMRSVFFVSICLAVGPVFIGMFAFPSLRRLWWGWVNTTLSNVVLALLVILTVVVLINAQTIVLTSLLANVQVGQARTFFGVQPAVNEWTQAGMLLGGAITAGFLWYVAKNLPGMAASITHGFAGMGQFRSMTMAGAGLVGGLGGFSGFSGFGGGSGGQSPGPPPAPAPPTPPGPSLSIGLPPSTGGARALSGSMPLLPGPSPKMLPSP